MGGGRSYLPAGPSTLLQAPGRPETKVTGVLCLVGAQDANSAFSIALLLPRDQLVLPTAASR